jgi:hypothetical protein
VVILADDVAGAALVDAGKAVEAVDVEREQAAVGMGDAGAAAGGESEW